MSNDAQFEDGREVPLNLGAVDVEDLKVMSSLIQDAVFPITEMSWQRTRRSFALLLNRFRWEDEGRSRHGAERVQSVLAFDDVLSVSSQGIQQTDCSLVLSLLNLDFVSTDETSGSIMLNLAGDGAIRLDVETIAVTLKDVTQPYVALSGKEPRHFV